MNYNIELDKELLVDALKIASAQRLRAQAKFKPGTAAHTELTNEADQLKRAADQVSRLPTPLEAAINKSK